MKEEVGDITLGDLKKWPLSVRVMIGLGMVVFFVIFAFYPAYPMTAGRSLVGWTWAACNSYNGFLHGRLVPLIFPWMIWWAWRCRKEEVVKPSYWGLIWVCFALILFWASMRSVQPRWALFGMPLLVIGLAQYLFGGRIAKAVVFPAFFLWFAIPVPGLEAFLRGQWTEDVIEVAVMVGGWCGMSLVRQGRTVIETGTDIHFAFG